MKIEGGELSRSMNQLVASVGRLNQSSEDESGPRASDEKTSAAVSRDHSRYEQ